MLHGENKTYDMQHAYDRAEALFHCLEELINKNPSAFKDSAKFSQVLKEDKKKLSDDFKLGNSEGVNKIVSDLEHFFQVSLLKLPPTIQRQALRQLESQGLSGISRHKNVENASVSFFKNDGKNAGSSKPAKLIPLAADKKKEAQVELESHYGIRGNHGL